MRRHTTLHAVVVSLVRWMLFPYEPSGAYVGQVQVPARVDPIVMRGNFIWATTCNNDAVPSVGRYRIVWR
jgi:hypothetical protein